MCLMRRDRRWYDRRAKERNFCKRVEVAVLTPPHGFMACGERESEKPSCRGLQEESWRRVKFQERQRSNLSTL